MFRDFLCLPVSLALLLLFPATLPAQREGRNPGTGTAPARRNHAAAEPRKPEPEPGADETVDLAAEARILAALSGDFSGHQIQIPS